MYRKDSYRFESCLSHKAKKGVKTALYDCSVTVLPIRKQLQGRGNIPPLLKKNISMKRHKQTINVFEFLKKKNICYAVCVAVNKNPFIEDESSLDLFIIAKGDDIIDIPELGFAIPEKDEDDRVFCRDLSREEQREFRNNLHIYKKVLSNKYGRIYELENNSFTQYSNKSK